MWVAESIYATVRLARDDPWRYASLLAGPLAIILVISKLLKYTVSVGAGTHETAAALGGPAAVLVAHGPMPLLLLVTALLFAALMQLRFAHLGSVFIPAVVATCAVGGSTVVAVLEAPPVWASLQFVEVIRTDLIVSLCLAIAGVTLITVIGFGRTLVLFLLHVACIAIGTLALVEVGYFLKTGSLADSFMLWYALTNLADLKYVLMNEIGWTQIAIMLVPFVLSFAPLVVANRRATSRIDLHRATPSWRIKRGYVLAFIAVAALAFTPTRPLEPAAASLRQSTPQALFGFAARAAPASSETGATSIQVGPGYGWVATDSTKDWNVVLIVLESTRANTFGAAATPFLDSLMAVSVSSREMAAVVPHTNKALVALLCGVPPPLNQGRSQVFVPTCLPDLLSDHGYHSAFFTPAQLAFEGKGEMLTQMGFDEAFGDEHWPEGDFAILNYFGREDAIVHQPSIEWMDARRAAGQPFLATFLTLAPHHDYGLPSRFEQVRYVPEDDRNAYLNALRYQDDFLRDLVRDMTRRGYLDDTVFIIVGDHGEAFGEHGLRYHSGVTYQEGLLVPAAVLAPTGELPTVSPGPSSHLDVVPTVRTLLGMDEEGGTLPGRSLLSGHDPSRRIYAASWLENQSMALRAGDMKYVYHYRRRPIEVFDLATDPQERQDLGASLAASERTAIERELLQWRASVNAFHAPESWRAGDE